jgi:hypothetical protein
MAQGGTSKRRKRAAWERAFLTVLAKGGNISRACKAAGIGRRTAYNVRAKHRDFAEAMEDAISTAADAFEAEAIRRAVKGVTRYKFYKGQAILHPTLCECDHDRRSHEQGARCLEEGCNCTHFQGQPFREQEYSDGLLALILKGLLPEKYRDSLGLDAAQIDDYIERRVAEMAEARANQIISRNGTAPPPPVTASQENALPDSGSAGPAAGGPAPGQGTPDPSTFYSDVPPLLPDGFPPRNRANGP